MARTDGTDRCHIGVLGSSYVLFKFILTTAIKVLIMAFYVYQLNALRVRLAHVAMLLYEPYHFGSVDLCLTEDNTSLAFCR